MTFGQMVDRTTEMYPDKECVVFAGEKQRRTFHQFREEMDRFASGLISIGVRRGDRVAIWGPNTLEWMLALFSTARIGGILVHLNPSYQTAEVEIACRKVGVKAIIASQPFRSQTYHEMLRDICPELETASPGHLRSKRLPSLKSVILMGDEQCRGSFRFSDIMEMGKPEHYDVIVRYRKCVQFDDVCNILFTSGTTGMPKAACLTHFQVINSMAIFSHISYTASPDKTWSICTPFFHIGGTAILILGMLTGATMVIPSAAFNSADSLRAIQDERCTHMLVVSTMLIDMVNHPQLAEFDVKSIQSVFVGGSPVPPKIVRQAETAFNATLNIVYGMTESSLTVTSTRDDDPEVSRFTSVGRVAPWMEVKITDPSTQVIVPVESVGELCVRSPCLMTGYWDDIENTKKAIDAAGWLHTGDLASMDKDGFISIIGRLKDVIIKGGENIFPAQIEKLIHTHPKIQDVQVVGVPDSRMIEELCACVRLKEGETCTREDIRELCNGKISRFLIPRYIEFVDTYPLTTSGKVQKFQLRRDMIARLGLDSVKVALEVEKT